jgi:twitching motility protein PilT
LLGVISQQLIPKRNGKGRAMAMEIMRTTNAIRNLIREEKTEQAYGAMQVGQEESGMSTMNQALIRMVTDGIITEQVATEFTTVPDELLRMLANLPAAKRARPPGT